MRIVLLALIYVFFSGIAIGQVPGNQRSSYAQLSVRLPKVSGKIPGQEVQYKEPIIVAPEQAELIKKHKVKTKKTMYDDGSWRIDYYNELGYKTKAEYEDEGIVYTETYSYELDGRGNIAKEIHMDSDTTGWIRHYTYDEKNRLIAKGYASLGEQLKYQNIYYNDKLGIRIEADSYGIDRIFLDSRGERLKFESYDENYKLLGVAEAEYDYRGFKIKEHSKMMGIGIEDEFTYNANGQLLTLARTSMVLASWEYRYNEKGLEIYFRNENHISSNTSTYEYTYY